MQVSDRETQQLSQSRCLTAVHIVLVVGDTPNIFHSSKVVLRDEDLIILSEGVFLAEEVFVELHTGLSNIEHFFLVHIGNNRLPGIDAHQRKTLRLTLMIAEGSGNDGVQVSRDAERLVEPDWFLVIWLSVGRISEELSSLGSLLIQSLPGLWCRLDFSLVTYDRPV